jgi:LPXTG-motif cell wall-anchored protein
VKATALANTGTHGWLAVLGVLLLAVGITASLLASRKRRA